MKHKIITIKESFEVDKTPHENDMNPLNKWIEQGYTVQNFSCTHVPKQDNVFGDTKEKTTIIFMVCSYLLVRQDN